MYIEFVRYKYQLEPVIVHPDEIGIILYTKRYSPPFNHIYEVINKQLFLLGVIKYNLLFTEIPELDVKKILTV